MRYILIGLICLSSTIMADPTFVDWISISSTTDTANGTLGGVDVDLATVRINGSDSVTNETSTAFSSLAFDPPLPTSDAVGIELLENHVTAITFSAAVLNPILHFDDIHSQIQFLGNPSVVKLSGESGFTVSNNILQGSVIPGVRDTDGTVQLLGSFTTISFTSTGVGGGDRMRFQVGTDSDAVPEPSTYLTFLCGFALFLRYRRK